MKVRIQLFGRAADEAGEREITLEVPEAATLRAVADRLVAAYPRLQWLHRAARPARNLEYAAWDDPVTEDDEVSFIPPVSGGGG